MITEYKLGNHEFYKLYVMQQVKTRCLSPLSFATNPVFSNSKGKLNFFIKFDILVPNHFERDYFF